MKCELPIGNLKDALNGFTMSSKNSVRKSLERRTYVVLCNCKSIRGSCRKVEIRCIYRRNFLGCILVVRINKCSCSCFTVAT